MTTHKLTLQCSAALGEQVIEFLLDDVAPEGAFAGVPVRLHGGDFTKATAGEQVRGHVEAMLIILLLADEQIARVLDALRGRFSGSGITYWIEPVTVSGEIA